MQRIEALRPIVSGLWTTYGARRLSCAALMLEVNDTDEEEAEDRVPAPASAPGQVILGLASATLGAGISISTTTCVRQAYQYVRVQ
jgi:hypothetical protein